MAPFPSPLERTVASALLLLSNMPEPPSPLPRFGFQAERKSVINNTSFSLVSTGSDPCSSSVTTAGSSKEVRSQKLRFFAVVARCHDLKPKVARKRRSQMTWTSDNRKLVLALPSTKGSSISASTEDSCLSSTSSAASCARSRSFITREVGMKKARAKKPDGSGSAHMRSQAEAILKLLSAGGCFSEVRIRQVLGDSPDTSKALRMLLKREKVKRSGTGGRVDPYIYKIHE